MRILLVAATKFEVRPSLKNLALVRNENDQVTCFQFRNANVDLLIPGIGMVQTAFHLGKLFSGPKYDLAINAGIAGSYSELLKLGEVVHVMEECITELGVEDGESFLSLFELGLMDPDFPPYQGGRLINKSGLPGSVISKLRKVKGATANTVHGNQEGIRKIKSKFNTDTESMEGAAFFYSCLSAGIPFAEIRSISNYVSERDKSRWNLELALKNLNKVLGDILKEICI